MDLDSGRLVAMNVEVSDPRHLTEENYVCEFMEHLIRVIGMVILGEPAIARVPVDEDHIDHPQLDDGGLTVQYVISTSHVAYHSWPAQNRFRLVVDSCRDFRFLDVVSMVKTYFPVKGNSVQDLPYLAPQDCYGQETTQAQAQAG